MKDWQDWALIISLVTPLMSGLGHFIESRWPGKGKKADTAEPVVQGLVVDYSQDYVALLKDELNDEKAKNKRLERELAALRRRLEGN